MKAVGSNVNLCAQALRRAKKTRFSQRKFVATGGICAYYRRSRGKVAHEPRCPPTLVSRYQPRN
jgi:hypothetical protein